MIYLPLAAFKHNLIFLRWDLHREQSDNKCYHSHRQNWTSTLQFKVLFNAPFSAISEHHPTYHCTTLQYCTATTAAAPHSLKSSHEQVHNQGLLLYLLFIFSMTAMITCPGLPSSEAQHCAEKALWTEKLYACREMGNRSQWQKRHPLFYRDDN